MRCHGAYLGNLDDLPSLKLANIAPENRPSIPKRKPSYSKHEFSGAKMLLVSGGRVSKSEPRLLTIQVVNKSVLFFVCDVFLVDVITPQKNEHVN